MNDDFNKVKKTLEFDKILKKLQVFTASSLAKEYIAQLDISTSSFEINRRLDETSEAVTALVKKGEPPLFGIVDIHPMMKRVQMGGSLTPGNLLKISDFLRVSRYLKTYLKKDEKDNEDLKLTTLTGHIESLYSNRQLEEKINRTILSDTEISDQASPRLASIRRSIHSKQEGIRAKLNSIVNEQKKYLQDSIITMREGRYVVPVKQEYKSRIKGLVHDISASGATVYIEPMSVVNMNNELKTLFINEKEEIEIILEKLSEEVFESSYEIDANKEILKILDFIFAKGKFSLEYQCNRPRINENKYIHLKNVKHPLLDQEKAVPITLDLGQDFTSLIITGPNTGGKTVTLKTVGLSILMVQFGLHIIAEESSDIGIFHKIFADIGDEQSIEQSLSTFSSHMINIVDIIAQADENSLVLFDELGAGTDPTEGAALARSIMDHMLHQKIRCLSTTHYNQLKIYALTTENVANASMEFDVDTLSPTFRLLIGVPGKSNAFEISKRLGLQNSIIEHAKELISEDSIEFEKVLASIEKDRSKIEKHRFEAEKQQRELEEKNRLLEAEIKKLKSSKDRVLEKAREEAKRIVLQTKDNMTLVLDEINELKDNLSSNQARKLQEAQDLFRESFQNVEKTKPKLVIEKAAHPIEEIKIGDRVKTGLGSEGTILELPDNKGNVLVQMGIMKINLPKDSLTRINPVEEEAQTGTKQILKQKAKNIQTEIDLRGKNFDDAKIMIDKYIDDAYLSGLKSVRLIHGKGTGILRKKVREDLRKHKNVKSYQDAPYNEGGDGVTIVELK